MATINENSDSVLFLARHGETTFNVENRMGGNPPLTAKGIKQAFSIATLLRGLKVDAIFCSALCRSKCTAEIISLYHPDAPLIEVPALVEGDAGELDSLTYHEFEEKFPELFAAKKRDKFNWVCPGGESYAMVVERVKPFIDDLATKKGNSIVVGHQGTNRAIFCCLLGLKGIEMLNLVIPNNAVFQIDMQNPSNMRQITVSSDG